MFRAWLKRPGSLFYGWFYHLRRWHEEHEVAVATTELLLISVTLAGFVAELVELVHRHEYMGFVGFVRRYWHEVGEAAIFGILLLAMASRAAIVFRRRHLGYDFSRLLAVKDERGDVDFDQVLRTMRALPWGTAPGVEGRGEGIAFSNAKAIAVASAMVLSERTLGSEDETWFRREEEYLLGWMQAFPWCVWHLADPALTAEAVAAGPGVTGYVSVIVPMTRLSALSIRKGHRATDNAEIDPAVIAHFQSGGRHPSGTGPAPVLDVAFLAYAHLRVPNSNAPVQHDQLLAASLQHLAVLLHGTFGGNGEFRRRWNFSVLCETANVHHEAVVLGLGFTELPTGALDKENAHHNPARSFAGFPLFQFVVRNGEASDDTNRVDGGRFLAFLEDRVKALAAMPAGFGEHGLTETVAQRSAE